MQAFFLDYPTSAGGSRFVVYHEPSDALRGAIVAVYPFAEEMNKSRRMIALGARALSRAGFAVLQVDCLGSGDSPGDLESAKWQDWHDDIGHSVDWLSTRHKAPVWLWGTRAGCLLVAEFARRSAQPFNLLFWQPQHSGRTVLQQFLRLKMASQMQVGSAKGQTESLQKQLASGTPVEIAGYRLGPGIADGLYGASLLPLKGHTGLCWFEVSTRQPTQLLPASGPALNALSENGFDVHAQAVLGPPFWQTLEIEDAPELITATVGALNARSLPPQQ